MVLHLAPCPALTLTLTLHIQLTHADNSTAQKYPHSAPFKVLHGPAPTSWSNFISTHILSVSYILANHFL